MEQIIRVRAIGVAAVIALGITVSAVTSTVVASRAYQGRVEQTSKAQQEMNVKGSARAAVRSDLGVWSISISGFGSDLKTAYGVLEFGIDRVQAFLTEQGFAESEINLSAIDTSTHMQRDKEGRETAQILGYTLRRSFTITSKDVERIAHAAGEVTRLLQENVIVVSSVPQYTYTKVADMKLTILGEASKDALARATQIAANSGCRVGEVRRASMGVIQITRPNSTAVSDYGLYDTSTIDKEISVVVSVTFAVVSQ